MRGLIEALGLGFVAVVALSGAAWAADGEAVYNASCAACHNNMDPKLGDKDAWAPLIKEGNDALVASTIAGKGAMPPRGGANISDDDIKAAVQYMIGKSQ